jgi:hypothetical protein
VNPKLIKDLLRVRRGVRVPCDKCEGFGIRMYGNTSTWRHGIGGAAMTNGVCDQCWGSGNSSKPWPSHKEFYDMKKELEKE